MIIVTGASGFIGSCIVSRLNKEGITDILAIDEPELRHSPALSKKNIREFCDKNTFIDRISRNTQDTAVECIFHMGACSSTTETDWDYLFNNNTKYTQTLALWAMKHSVRFIYASSAATYGNGSRGFSDDDHITPALEPLNLYGRSKQTFDLWALQEGALSSIIGLKFFNVFGPNEYNKGPMSSVILKAFHQIRETGMLKLFRSYHPDYKDGEQKRDFVYVKDCLDVLMWLMKNPSINGLFNLGTGVARTWNDLGTAVFSALGRPPAIEHVEMPEALREKYQYYTQADMKKLAGTGCPVRMGGLEENITDYVRHYLMRNEAWY